MAYTYTELDEGTRRQAIQSRIRDLENQHFTLSLRVNAPDIGAPPSESDRTNLKSLEDSLAALKQELDAQT